MLELTSKVEDSEAFQKVEWGRGRLIKEKLRKLFPPGGILSRKASPFCWMAVADFFFTREAAGLLEPLSPELREVAPQTISHLKWRFFQFFSDSKLLGVMGGPVLANVISEFRRKIAVMTDCEGHDSSSSSSNIIRDVHVYCCHDMTLLALHRCLGSIRYMLLVLCVYHCLPSNTYIYTYIPAASLINEFSTHRLWSDVKNMYEILLSTASGQKVWDSGLTLVVTCYLTWVSI